MGTYNYPARELADEINTLLNNLEGDFQLGELEKALGPVAVEHTLALDGVEVCAKCGQPAYHHDPSSFVHPKSPRRK